VKEIRSGRATSMTCLRDESRLEDVSRYLASAGEVLPPVGAANRMTRPSAMPGADRAAYGERLFESLAERLSFSHLVELVGLSEPLARAFYDVECIRGQTLALTVRDPYVFEFLGLTPREVMGARRAGPAAARRRDVAGPAHRRASSSESRPAWG